MNNYKSTCFYAHLSIPVNSETLTLFILWLRGLYSRVWIMKWANQEHVQVCHVEDVLAMDYNNGGWRMFYTGRWEKNQKVWGKRAQPGCVNDDKLGSRLHCSLTDGCGSYWSVKIKVCELSRECGIGQKQDIQLYYIINITGLNLVATNLPVMTKYSIQYMTECIKNTTDTLSWYEHILLDWYWLK